MTSTDRPTPATPTPPRVRRPDEPEPYPWWGPDPRF